MFRIDGQEVAAEPGDAILVAAGRKHQFWNAGDEEVRFACEVRPALQFEQLIETMFSLARAGKTNRKGMPNPLRLAVIAQAHFDTVRLPFPPVWMQRVGPRARGAARTAVRLRGDVRAGHRAHRDRGRPGMTWRRRLRRRLLWAGVLFGLVVLLATVSVIRGGLWAREQTQRLVTPRRRYEARIG